MHLRKDVLKKDLISKQACRNSKHSKLDLSSPLNHCVSINIALSVALYNGQITQHTCGI